MGNEYKNILVAVDGSDQAFEALKEAIEVVKRNNAKLFLITAINFSPWSTDAQVMQLLLSESEKSAKDIVTKAKKQIPLGIECNATIMHGNPKACIVQFSKENDIDLIVMGATGKGAITRALIGSTTSYVVNHAPCNVLVVR